MHVDVDVLNPMITSVKPWRTTINNTLSRRAPSAILRPNSLVLCVTDVAISHETGRLDITSDAPVDFDRIVEAVAEAGDQYSVA